MGKPSEKPRVTPIEPERLFANSGISIERLPLLKSLFEQFRTYLVDRFGDIATAQVVASMEEVSPGRAGKIMEGAEPGTVTAIIEALAWDSVIAIRLDRKLLLALFETALGGDRSAAENAEDDGRPLSRLEMRLTAAICEKVVNAMTDSFSQIGDPKFQLVKLERRREATALGPENTLVIVARYRIESLYRGGDLHIIIPQRAILPLRAVLSRPPNAMVGNTDPQWVAKMRREVGRAAVQLNAVLAEKDMSLGDVCDLKVGQVLPLATTLTSPCKMTCEGQTLFRCTLGQAEGNFTLRVDETVESEVRAAASRATA